MAEPEILVPLNSVQAPWFIDPTHTNVFSGDSVNMRCVAVIGPHDFSRAMLVATGNPRRRLRDVRVAASLPKDGDLVVHACAWSHHRSAPLVLAEALALLDAAKVLDRDGWRTFPVAYLSPLLQRAAERAKVKTYSHTEFATAVRAKATARLRKRLLAAGVDRETVEAHRYI